MSNQMYMYSVFHNAHFQSSFAEYHDVNVCDILISNALVAFNRWELGDNIVTFWDDTSNQPAEICYIGLVYIQVKLEELEYRAKVHLFQ